MHWLRWVVLALALFQGGWLLFDGTRALRVGDYVTPRSGPRAGQLGPWSRVVSALGIEPRSRIMKCFHVFLGGAWLTTMVVFALQPVSGRWLLMCSAVATLWYLPVGTVLSLLLLVLLFFLGTS